MSRSNPRTLIAALVAALALAGCASTATQQSTGEHIDDAGITGKVKAALVEDPLVKAGQVDVETYRGVVQLNGFVESPEAKTQATSVARSVSGVTEVHNNLEIHMQARTVGTVVDDATITAKVKTALIGNEETKARQINVETREGVVQLSGFVDDTQEARTAETVARGVAGVVDVENELEVKP